MVRHRICLTGAGGHWHDACVRPISDRPRTIGNVRCRQTANWRICAFVLLLFIVASTLSAVRKDVTRGFDEVAHASYVAHLQHSGEIWPAFEDMRMLDPSSFRFTSEQIISITPRPIMCCWPASVPPWKAIPTRS